MEHILFVKYNRLRRPEFQISTVLYEKSGESYVKKSALNDKAEEHIKNLQKNCLQLNKMHKAISWVKAHYSEDCMEVSFPYVEGENLDEVLSKNISSLKSEQILRRIEQALDRIFTVDDSYKQKFLSTKQFETVFGNLDFSGEDALVIANIDMIFENIILQGEMWYGIDYEWVFPFPVPIKFLKYRILYYFYDKHKAILQQKFQKEEFFAAFSIGESDCEKCEIMEERFQQYVFGEHREYRYMDSYQTDAIKFEQLRISQSELEKVQQRILTLQEEEEERNNHILKLDKEIEEYDAKLNAVQYELEVKNRQIVDKDRHIRNIEALVTTFREPAEKWQKLMRFLPIRILRYVKRCMKKVYLKLKDMHHKKLILPMVKNPKVSIVIPAYNQFEYTYACVKSIIEYTKDCSYEVILADDVSTDRTKNIKKYIKNIIVSRNAENLRFLRNCNQAAKLARGQYILFLNNDTTVNPQWLSSLVALIESDESIGMVGSKLVYPDGTLQEAGGIIWSNANGWNYGRNQDASMPEYNYVKEVDYISGAAIMIRHSLWKQLGGFDELFVPAYCEDSDLAFQVRESGYKVMYQPKSVVTHYEGVSNGTDLTSGIKKYQVENNEKFKMKWAQRLKEQYPDAQNPFCARERNFSDKTILFIDHYVPTYDKDAGSKTTFQYIKMFLSKGYRVKFIGDNFAKMEPYTDALQQLGVEVLYGEWYQEHVFDWIRENQESIQFAYLNRPHISEKYIDFIKKETNIKIIYYGHDLHFLRIQREAEIEKNDALLSEAAMWRQKEFSLMKKAEISYYPSYVEEMAIHAIDKNIMVKAITAYVYDTFKEKFQFKPETRNGILFVGGFSHTPNIDAVEWFAEQIYPSIKKQLEIPFFIVGSNAPEQVKQLDGNGIVFKGFVTDEELDRLYESCKLVVVPLRYGAGVKGKVVEALYNGIPIVTTSVGAEGIKDVESVAVIEDNPEEFANRVVELYRDDCKLIQMSDAAQQFVRNKFSIDAVWNIIKDDFQ